MSSRKPSVKKRRATDPQSDSFEIEKDDLGIKIKIPGRAEILYSGDTVFVNLIAPEMRAVLGTEPVEEARKSDARESRNRRGMAKVTAAMVYSILDRFNKMEGTETEKVRELAADKKINTARLSEAGIRKIVRRETWQNVKYP